MRTSGVPPSASASPRQAAAGVGPSTAALRHGGRSPAGAIPALPNRRQAEGRRHVSGGSSKPSSTPPPNPRLAAAAVAGLSLRGPPPCPALPEGRATSCGEARAGAAMEWGPSRLKTGTERGCRVARTLLVVHHGTRPCLFLKGFLPALFVWKR